MYNKETFNNLDKKTRSEILKKLMLTAKKHNHLDDFDILSNIDIIRGIGHYHMAMLHYKTGSYDFIVGMIPYNVYAKQFIERIKYFSSTEVTPSKKAIKKSEDDGPYRPPQFTRTMLDEMINSDHLRYKIFNHFLDLVEQRPQYDEYIRKIISDYPESHSNIASEIVSVSYATVDHQVNDSLERLNNMGVDFKNGFGNALLYHLLSDSCEPKDIDTVILFGANIYRVISDELIICMTQGNCFGCCPETLTHVVNNLGIELDGPLETNCWDRTDGNFLHIKRYVSPGSSIWPSKNKDILSSKPLMSLYDIDVKH